MSTESRCINVPAGEGATKPVAATSSTPMPMAAPAIRGNARLLWRSRQKIGTSARQVERVYAGDSRNGELGPRGVERPMPTPASDRDAAGSQAIDRRECEALRFSVVPPEPRKSADILGQFLLQIHPESVFECAVAAGVCNIRGSTAHLGLADGLGIGARIGAILVVQRANDAGMLPHVVAVFALEDVAAIPKQPAVEPQAIGHPGHGGAGIPQRPASRVELMHPAPGVAAHVGRVVPRAVVHHRPTHELSPRIVSVAVIVEEVRQREAPCGDGVADHRTPAT